MEEDLKLEEVLRGTLELLETSPEWGKYEIVAERLKHVLLRCLAKFDLQKAS